MYPMTDEDDHGGLQDIFMPQPAPSAQNSQQLTQLSSSGFSRQDSLAICAKLQERDRSDHDMKNFMDESLDLDKYMDVLRSLDVEPDQITDWDETELQKLTNASQHQQGHPEYEPFAPALERPHPQTSSSAFDMHADGLLVPQKSERNHDSSFMFDTEPLHHMITKQEPVWEGSSAFSEETGSPSPSPSTTSAATTSSPSKKQQIQSITTRRRTHKAISDDELSDVLSEYTPKTKARKYTLKAPSEKANPSYKVKRARNNDAVRRSRTKAKELQMQRDEELNKLKSEVSSLKAKLAAAEKRVEDQKTMITRLTGGRRQ